MSTENTEYTEDAEDAAGGEVPEELLAEQAEAVRAGATEEVVRMVSGGEATRKELAAWLKNVLPPGADDKTCDRAAKALQKEGTAVVPVPEVAHRGPLCVPLRLFEDVWVPANCRDVQDARCVILREWVGAAELKNRVLTRGYDAAWVRDLLERGNEGMSCLPVSPPSSVPEMWGSWGAFMEWRGAEASEASARAGSASTMNRGVWEVLTCYRKAATGDGVPGVFVVPFSGFLEKPARGEELLEYEHGKYPFVLLVREMLSHYVWESRSIPEIAATDQGLLKMLGDTFGDHTMLSTVPPLKVPANRPDFVPAIGPADLIREDRQGQVEWMSPPAYPQSNESFRRDLWRRINEFYGRPAEGVPQEFTQAVSEELVDDHMPAVGEVIAQMLQLCGQFMPPDVAGQILGIKADEAADVLAQLSQRLSVQVSFDARMLSREWLKGVGELIGTYLLSWDSEATVDRAAVVRYLAERISPELARVALRPVDAANRRELDDEDANIAKMAVGVEPPMMEAGQNYRARLGRIYSALDANPELDELFRQKPVSGQILEARVKHLQGMIQQQENAQIGRLMAKPALG